MHFVSKVDSYVSVQIHSSQSGNFIYYENFGLVDCVLHPIDSELIKRRHPHLLSLAKDMKLGFYTVPTRNRTPGCRVAVHYTTAAPRQLLP